MTLYELLSTLKTNIKVFILSDTETYTVYTDSLELLDEAVQGAIVKEWELKDRVSIAVTIEQAIPSA